MKHYLFLLTLLLFISCIKEDNKNFADSLSNAYGVEYEVVKQNTLLENFVVVKNQDTGAYTAYDLSGYSTSMNQDEFKSYLTSENNHIVEWLDEK